MDHLKNTPVLEVEAETVQVRVRPEERLEVKSQSTYAHHKHYGEGYTAPELPEGFKPYQSQKAKFMLVVSSVALAVVTFGVVKSVQEKLLSHQFQIPMPQHVSYGQQEMARTMDMMNLNTLAFEKSLNSFGKVVENKKALVEVETVIHQKKYNNTAPLTDEEARDLLLRAGYNPSQITDEQMASFKKRYNHGVDGDVEFVRDVAGDIVKEEVESFVHKAKIISNVGEYIYNRLQE